MGTADLDWPDELDALTAAPTNHQLLLENDRVVDGETLLRPERRGGETQAHVL